MTSPLGGDLRDGFSEKAVETRLLTKSRVAPEPLRCGGCSANRLSRQSRKFAKGETEQQIPMEFLRVLKQPAEQAP